MLRCTEEVVRRIETPVDHMLGALRSRMRQGNALFRTWKVRFFSHLSVDITTSTSPQPIRLALHFPPEAEADDNSGNRQ